MRIEDGAVRRRAALVCPCLDRVEAEGDELSYQDMLSSLCAFLAVLPCAQQNGPPLNSFAKNAAAGKFVVACAVDSSILDSSSLTNFVVPSGPRGFWFSLWMRHAANLRKSTFPVPSTSMDANIASSSAFVRTPTPTSS
eukprot:5763839-Prymnesium_polylepis.1